MDAILCTVSDKRLEQLEADPDLLSELLGARAEAAIPGLFDLGKAWEALDLMISDRGKDAVLKDAVLARTGRKLRASTAFGPARLLPPMRVAEVAEALSRLPHDLVKQRYPRLAGKNVHGGYGHEVASPDDVKFLRDKVKQTQERELVELETKFARVRELYVRAAKAEHSMMSVVV
jgi:hypothetical protein